MNLTHALLPAVAGLVLTCGDAWFDQARADESYSLAIVRPDVGGVIDYIQREDGSLDGRFAYYRDAGRLNPELARPTKRGKGFVGSYASTGSVNGKPYTATLTINLLGRDATTKIDYYSLDWHNGDTGVALGMNNVLVGGFGVESFGFLVQETGSPITLTTLSWVNGTPRNAQYVLDGKTVVGTHNATPKVGNVKPETIRISRNGDTYRLEFSSGAKGVMMNTERTGSAPVAKAPAQPATPPVAKAPASPLPSGNPPPVLTARASTTSEKDLTPEFHFGCAIALGFIAEIASKEPAKAKIYDAAAEYIIVLGVERAVKAGTKREAALKSLEGMTKVKADLYGRMPTLASAESVACSLAGLWPKM